MQCSKRCEVNTEKSVWQAVVFLEVEEGGQDPDEEAVKVYLIRFIADLPLRLVYGLRDCVPLRVEFHSNSGPPTQKNSGLVTQKLLAASNGELYTAM